MPIKKFGEEPREWLHIELSALIFFKVGRIIKDNYRNNKNNFIVEALDFYFSVVQYIDPLLIDEPATKMDFNIPPRLRTKLDYYKFGSRTASEVVQEAIDRVVPQRLHLGLALYGRECQLYSSFIFLFLLFISFMTFQPLSNHVFLKPVEEEKVTKSGIVIPDTADREKPMRGEVLAIGPGKVNEKGERTPLSVKVGDIVLFKKYGPDEVELDGVKYLVGDEDDILAIIQ